MLENEPEFDIAMLLEDELGDSDGLRYSGIAGGLASGGFNPSIASLMSPPT